MDRNEQNFLIPRRFVRFNRQESVPPSLASLQESVSPGEIKRQFAIYELLETEEKFIRRLEGLHTEYYLTVKRLGILEDAEGDQVFGSTVSLLPLHEELLTTLQSAQKEDGQFDCVGEILVNWVLRMKQPYGLYCKTIHETLSLVHKLYSENDSFKDFLLRCRSFHLSEKLELWDLLDEPRKRIFHYSAIFQNIKKRTLPDHPDWQYLEQLKSTFDDIIRYLNYRTSKAECAFIQKRLYIVDDYQIHVFLSKATEVLCRGLLKEDGKTVLTGLLFDTGFVLAKQETDAEDKPYYRVYREPIPAISLFVTDVSDTDSNVNIFKVSDNHLRTYCLQVEDFHNKQQWVKGIKKVRENAETVFSAFENEEEDMIIVENRLSLDEEQFPSIDILEGIDDELGFVLITLVRRQNIERTLSQRGHEDKLDL